MSLRLGMFPLILVVLSMNAASCLDSNALHSDPSKPFAGNAPSGIARTALADEPDGILLAAAAPLPAPTPAEPEVQTTTPPSPAPVQAPIAIEAMPPLSMIPAAADSLAVPPVSDLRTPPTRPFIMLGDPLPAEVIPVAKLLPQPYVPTPSPDNPPARNEEVKTGIVVPEPVVPPPPAISSNRDLPASPTAGEQTPEPPLPAPVVPPAPVEAPPAPSAATLTPPAETTTVAPPSPPTPATPAVVPSQPIDVPPPAAAVPEPVVGVAEPQVSKTEEIEAVPPVAAPAPEPPAAPVQTQAATVDTDTGDTSPEAIARMVGGRDFVLDMNKPKTVFPANARDLGAIRKRGVLVVGQQNGDNPPFYFFQPGTGRLVGLDMDIAIDLAKHLGVNLVINRSYPTFQTVAEAVAAGEVDIGVTNLSVTDERRKIVDFSEPYIVGYMALLINFKELEKRLPGVEVIGPADLNNEKVIISAEQNSSFEGDLAAIFPKATPRPETYGPGDKRYASLLDGHAQVMLRDTVSMLGELLSNPEVLAENGGPLTYTPMYNTADPIAVPIAKSAPALRAAIDQFFDNQPDVPTTTSVLKKYAIK